MAISRYQQSPSNDKKQQFIQDENLIIGDDVVGDDPSKKDEDIADSSRGAILQIPILQRFLS